MLELERRYRLTPRLRERLDALGAEWSAPRRVVDITLGLHGANSMTEDGWVIRLRQDGDSKFLQLKKAVDASGQRWSELSVSLGSLSISYDILVQIGLTPGLVIARTRSVTQIGPCDITVDEVDYLGSFLEISFEADNDETAEASISVIEKLILSGEELPEPPYGQQMRTKLLNDTVLRARLEADIRQLLAHEGNPA